ncbi:MAG: VWA domain-containing protein [Prochlorotrichaceae cyanobacterium]
MANDRSVRWRLILGTGSESACGGGLSAQEQAMDRAMSFLYDREAQGRNIRQRSQEQDRAGGDQASQLTVPDWINQIHSLFPQKTIERLEKDALERYNLEEMVTNPDLLSRAQPSETLLKAILRTKHLMNPQVLHLARDLVRKAIAALMEKLARPVQSPFWGTLNRRQRSSLKIAKNFDAKTTIQRNLKHYDPQGQRIVIHRPYFSSRHRRQVDRWQIIIVVDQSGSMLDSVIHSAITASIFFGIPSLKPHLILFDTAIVDVTEYCTDPVETLMKVQLGGGTNIAQALQYASSLVTNPRKTIVILITDFYEGGSPANLLNITRQLVESGVLLLGLAALDEKAHPQYDRTVAQQMVNLGASVGAMTPGELALWVAERVR